MLVNVSDIFNNHAVCVFLCEYIAMSRGLLSVVCCGSPISQQQSAEQ